MRKTATLLAILMLVATSAFAANALRISQVYGGGGGSSGAYLHDYVELFNSGPVAINLSGYSIQYGSATGSSFGSTTGNYLLLSGTIPACGYFLVETGTAGSAGGALPVVADQTAYTQLNLSASGGKVALMSVTTGGNLCSGSTLGGNFVDVVGYGSTTNCYETSPAGGTTSASAVVRAGDGMTDTDNNSTDFAVTGTNFVTIHNSQSALNGTCAATPATPSTWGTIKSIYR